MPGSARYRPNVPRVISEVIDDEAVVIDLDTGSYFSLVGSGAQIWTAVEAGATAEQVVAALDQRSTGLPDEVESLVAGFLDQLTDLELAVALDPDDPRAGPPAAPDDLVDASSPDPVAFVAPELTRFDDMQELILLDPIHEVDEQQGWPSAKVPTSTDG